MIVMANTVRPLSEVKEEALSKMILFGERSLQHVLKEYEYHFHRERPHQAKGNIILMPTTRQAHSGGGQIHCRKRLGGLLKYYYRQAA